MDYLVKVVEKPADRDIEGKNLNLKGLAPFSFFVRVKLIYYYGKKIAERQEQNNWTFLYR